MSAECPELSTSEIVSRETKKILSDECYWKKVKRLQRLIRLLNKLLEELDDLTADI